MLASICKFLIRPFTSTTNPLPEFGLFKKQLDHFINNPTSLPILPFNVTPSDLKSIDNDPNVCRLLRLEQDRPDNRHFRHALRRFAISFFARRPNDTGCPEVQIALSTVRMALLEKHLEGKTHVHDFKSERALVQARAERRKMLKYLRRLSLERFYVMLDRLGLPLTYIEENETRYPCKYRTGKKIFKMPKNRTVRPVLSESRVESSTAK